MVDALHDDAVTPASERGWAIWRDLVAKAADGSHQTIESIERTLEDGSAQLLTATGCCFIVELTNYPTERACQVMWSAGTLDAILAALPGLHAWAKAQGCTEMLVEGHAAWQRALKPLGYRPWSVTIRKAL